MNEIIPGILETSWEEIEAKINLCKGFTRTIHIDFIDGKFSQNTTFLDFQKFSSLSKDLFLEAHLMVDEPIDFIKPLADAGFKRFVGHIEKMGSQEDFVVKAQEMGEVGLALDFKTPIEEIKVSFEDLDTVLVMGVNAGFSGQQFLPDSLEKVREIRKNSLVNIEIDGGVNDKNIRDIEDAGANYFISTSFLFKGDIKTNFETLSSLVFRV